MFKRNITNISLLFFIAMIWGMLFLSSCGKGSSVSPSALNIQYQIINLSPDLQSVDLYVNFIKANSSSFFYPTSSGYFMLPSTDTPFQIRTGASTIPGTVLPIVNYFTMDDILKANTNYTLFITGMKADSTLSKILLADTSSAAAVGRGKIRFINASPGTTGLDIYANGVTTKTFTNVKFSSTDPMSSVTKFVELQAGTYDFQIFPAGSTTNRIADIPNYTIADGRLYNFYAYGLPGHTTDSLAFGTNIIQVPLVVIK